MVALNRHNISATGECKRFLKAHLLTIPHRSELVAEVGSFRASKFVEDFSIGGDGHNVLAGAALVLGGGTGAISGSRSTVTV